MSVYSRKMSVRKISLSQSYKAYEKAFKTFLDHSTARQAIMKCVQDGTKLALEKIVPLDVNKPFNILGVGSGKGEMDLLIIQFIAAQLKKTDVKPAIHSLVVEPSSFLLEKFKESVASLPNSLTDLARVSFEWQQTTFQEYKQLCAIQDEKSQPSFDFIHFVHSIYYMDAADALQTCFEQQLGEKGAIVCLVQTERSYFPMVQKRFKGRLTFGSEDMVIYTEEDLAKIAGEKGWKYDVIIQEFSIDVSLCFGEPSEQGDLLFDFLTHQKDFRATADQELIHDLLDFFGEFIVPDENGNKLLRGPEMAAVVIQK